MSWYVFNGKYSHPWSLSHWLQASSILPDLLTAPPHLPAKPLHLLQLHDGENKRYNAQSSCCCFPQLGLRSSSPFWFCTAPNSVWQAYNPQHSLTPVVQRLETSPTISFSLPLQGLFSSTAFFPILFLFPHTILAFLSVSLLSGAATGLQNMPFHFASVTFPLSRLHSAAYPFLESAFQSSSVFPLPLFLFFFL